jgi:hypothetical protein
MTILFRYCMSAHGVIFLSKKGEVHVLAFSCGVTLLRYISLHGSSFLCICIGWVHSAFECLAQRPYCNCAGPRRCRR